MIASNADIKIISSLTVAKVFLSVGLHLFCLEWKITFKLDYKFLFNAPALSLYQFCFLSYECLWVWIFVFPKRWLFSYSCHGYSCHFSWSSMLIFDGVRDDWADWLVVLLVGIFGSGPDCVAQAWIHDHSASVFLMLGKVYTHAQLSLMTLLLIFCCIVLDLILFLLGLVKRANWHWRWSVQIHFLRKPSGRGICVNITILLKLCVFFCLFLCLCFAWRV